MGTTLGILTSGEQQQQQGETGFISQKSNEYKNYLSNLVHKHKLGNNAASSSTLNLTSGQNYQTNKQQMHNNDSNNESTLNLDNDSYKAKSDIYNVPNFSNDNDNFFNKSFFNAHGGFGKSIKANSSSLNLNNSS